jgi:hypothetical protein
MLRVFGTITTAVITIGLFAACGSGAEQPAVATRSRSPTSVRPTPRTLTPVPSPVIDRDACDRAPGTDDRFRVAAHDESARNSIAEIEAALGSAIDHSGPVYGWTPVELFCVHVFSTEDAFVTGLQAFLGLGDFANEFRDNSGTVYFDWDKGRDAIFLNMSATRSAGRTITHEYHHIVQGYVEHGGAPVWFLEGIAEWEAARLQGDPDPGWLSSFVAQEQLGLAPKLSGLVNQHQWLAVDESAAYARSRLAVMYLESIAGPDAPPSLLTNENVIDAPAFEAGLRDLTGLSLEEFDGRLLAFAEELVAQNR